MRQRKNKNGEKSAACVVYYKSPYMEWPKNKDEPLKERLMLCIEIDLKFGKGSYIERMQTKALYNLHIHIDADDIKDAFSRLCL